MGENPPSVFLNEGFFNVLLAVIIAGFLGLYTNNIARSLFHSCADVREGGKKWQTSRGSRQALQGDSRSFRHRVWELPSPGKA